MCRVMHDLCVDGGQDPRKSGSDTKWLLVAVFKWGGGLRNCGLTNCGRPPRNSTLIVSVELCPSREWSLPGLLPGSREDSFSPEDIWCLSSVLGAS